jgi:hypothetical protein
MKKSINIKSSKLLVESSIKVGDVDYEKKLRRRVVDLRRARDMAAAAKQRAEANGQPDIAQKLEDKIVELDDLLATYNADTIDDEDNAVGASSDTKNKNGKDVGDDSDEGDGTEDESEDGDDEGDGDDEQDGEDGDDSDGDAADTDDSDGDDKGKQNKGNKGDPGDESDEDDDDSDEGGNGDPSDDDDSDEGGNGDPLDKDDDDSDEGENGDPKSKPKKSDPEEDGDDEGGNGDPGADPETSDDDSDGDSEGEGGNGDPGAKSKKNKGDSDDGDDSGDSEGDDDSGDDDGSQGSSSKSKSKGDKKNDSGETDGDSESDEDDSDEGDDSDNDSNEQSDGKSSQSKTKPSLDPNDSSSNSNAQPEYKNPFADEEDIPGGLGSMSMGGEPPRDATMEETIELLKTLKGEGRKGAIDALKDLIAKRKAANGGATESFQSTGKESLTEAVKRVRDMTDDEFGDYINDVYDLIGQADEVDYVDDIEARKQKIGQWSQDPLAIQELQAEDNLELQKDYQKKKARDAAKAKYSKMGTLKDFEMDFYSAINNQIEMVRQEYQSYDEINTEYESEDVVMKADLVKELPAEAIPIVDVYFDVSGSWEEKHIKVGESAIASVKVFEDQGDLKLNIFYFSNGVDNVSMEHCRDMYGTGTCGWPDILQNIKATGAKNVLIMSDGDIERLNDTSYGAATNGSLTVEGCVWYLWKDGDSSPTCLKKLRGMQGTSQFSFHA